MPDWTVSFVIVLIIIGFIPTVIAAWAYELTPEGIRPDTAVTAPAPTSSSSDRKLMYIILVLVMLIGGMQFVTWVGSSSNTTTVLPGNETPSPNTDTRLSRRASIYLGDLIVRGSLGRTDIALSRDGSLLAYTIRASNGDNALWLRDLVTNEQRFLMGGSERVDQPFFSPEGEWIAFQNLNNGGVLDRISAFGGTRIPLASSPGDFLLATH